MILNLILNLQTGSIFCFGGRWSVPCFLLRRMSTISMIHPWLDCPQQVLHVNWGPWDTSQVPDTNTLHVSQHRVREYLATDTLPCALFFLLPRVPWFLVERQPLRVSWLRIQDAPRSGSQVKALRIKMLVWGCVLWAPPISQFKCSKKILVEYCAVLPIL